MAFLGFVNLTPYAAQPYLMTDENGGDLLVLVTKATYRIVGQDAVALEEEQPPPDAAGSSEGEPGQSSLRYAPEIDIFKPATDVALVGHAHAPGGGTVTQVDVTLRVGPLRKTVRVFGDRQWETKGQTVRISEPKPFTSLPLVYERAFGGSDLTSPDPRHHERDGRNPVGIGLVAVESRRQRPLLLPNLEDPSTLISGMSDRPPPAGFGFIAPDWEWRLRYAGTYDDRWEKNRMPLLPEDFDRRFYNAAHPDLIANGYLTGGEPVEVGNASPGGHLAFTLPTERPEGVVMMKDTTSHPLAMNLDTVVIDTDGHRLTLLWRATFPVYRKIYDILSITSRLAGTAGEEVARVD